MKKRMIVMAMLASVCSAMLAWAARAPAVTPTLIGRFPYPAFKAESEPVAPYFLKFEAKAKGPMDMVLRVHDYDAMSNTGWHGHPGPVFINVLQGVLYFYDYNDPTCTPTIVSAGHGYVDSGSGHIAVNPSGTETAKDISVIIAPSNAAHDAPFRINLPADEAACKLF